MALFTPPKKRVTQPTNPGWGNASTAWQPVSGTQPITEPYNDPVGTPGPINLPAIQGALNPNEGRSIFVGGEPAYRGILDRYTGDMRARINAGVAAMGAQRLSNARGVINRLGVRDPTALLGQVGQYGLTLADLQQAADNPWSNLKALAQQAQSQRGAMIADRSARGGIRSGGSSRGVRLIEENRARQEAQASQDALQALAQGQFEASEYERNAWDQFNDRSFQMEQMLAQQYQPQEALWDANYGGYRAGNRVYDQNGNLIRTI